MHKANMVEADSIVGIAPFFDFFCVPLVDRSKMRSRSHVSLGVSSFPLKLAISLQAKFLLICVSFSPD